MWDQVVPSYFKEINRSWGTVVGAKGDPLDHSFDFLAANGSRCHLEVMFRAVGDSDLEEFFRGLEVTAFWIPECDTHASADILTLALNRVGRYPEPDDRPVKAQGEAAAYKGVFFDSNAPVVDTWFHDRFYLNRRAGEKVFIQPSGLSPNRENWRNLSKIDQRYYENMAEKLADPWAVRRLIENKPGFSRHGQPVHEYFDGERHVARQAIEAVPDQTLFIGGDCGNTLSPAAVFLQRVYGQARALDEVCPDGQMDLVEYAAEIKRIRETRFRHVKHAVLIVDPSAATKSTVNRQLSFAQILQAQTEIEVILAPTNDPLARRTAMDQALKRSGMPGEPGFLIDPRCVGLIKALYGAYHFERKGQKISPTPKKDHPWSDIAEAGQYGILGMEGLGLSGMGGVYPPSAAERDHGHLASILQE